MIGMSKYQRHARDVLGGDHEKAGTFASGAGDDDPHHAHGEELDAFDDDDDDDDVTLGGGSDRDEKLEEQLAAKSVVNHLTENYRVSSFWRPYGPTWPLTLQLPSPQVRIDRQQLSSFLLPSSKSSALGAALSRRPSDVALRQTPSSRSSHTPATSSLEPSSSVYTLQVRYSE